jgi:hypothetical protein
MADMMVRCFGDPEDMDNEIWHPYALIEALFNVWDQLARAAE